MGKIRFQWNINSIKMYIFQKHNMWHAFERDVNVVQMNKMNIPLLFPIHIPTHPLTHQLHIQLPTDIIQSMILIFPSKTTLSLLLLGILFFVLFFFISLFSFFPSYAELLLINEKNSWCILCHKSKINKNGKKNFKSGK